jgi:RpiR family transcriptional regulator, carbohydrate utilization regulator
MTGSRSHSAAESVSNAQAARPVWARVQAVLPSLTDAERRVAQLISDQPDVAVRLSGRKLAESVGVSEATVIRFCQAAGYEGLRELKLELAAEALATTPLVPSAVEKSDDLATLAAKVFRTDVDALTNTHAILDIAAVKRAVDAIARASRLDCYGAGSSVPVAIDAYYRFLRLGLPAVIATDSHMQAISATHLPPGAVVFAVSHSGRSFETYSSVSWAKKAGATCILLTSHPDTPMSKLADIELVVASVASTLRPEAVASRLAHLMVVDVLSVAVAMRRSERLAADLAKDDAIVEEREIEE